MSSNTVRESEMGAVPRILRDLARHEPLNEYANLNPKVRGLDTIAW
jgi:hypothetical protein